MSLQVDLIPVRVARRENNKFLYGANACVTAINFYRSVAKDIISQRKFTNIESLKLSLCNNI